MKQLILACVIGVLCGAIQATAQQYCQYSETRGTWLNCYDGSELCGAYQYCVHVQCYATGEQVANGCWPRSGSQC